MVATVARFESNWKPLGYTQRGLSQVLYGNIQSSIKEFGSQISLCWGSIRGMI